MRRYLRNGKRCASRDQKGEMGIQPVYGERGSVILSEFIINSGNIHALIPHVPCGFFGEGEREYPRVDALLSDPTPVNFEGALRLNIDLN